MRRILLVRLPCLSLPARRILHTILHLFWPWLCGIVVLYLCSPGGEVVLLWRKVCNILQFHQTCWWSCYSNIFSPLSLVGAHSRRCAFRIMQWYQVSVLLSRWHVRDTVFCSIALWCWGAIWWVLGRVCLCTLFLAEPSGRIWVVGLLSARLLRSAFSGLES